jgi:hypothetical protein
MVGKKIPYGLLKWRMWLIMLESRGQAEEKSGMFHFRYAFSL